MKIYIIPDPEGVAGIVKFRQDLQEIDLYEAMCRRTVREINACIESVLVKHKLEFLSSLDLYSFPLFSHTFLS